MLKGVKGVLFDLDGTLVDSMGMWKGIDEAYLKKKGIPLPENVLEFQKELEGMGFTETAVFFKKRFSIPDSLEAIKESWIAMAIDKYTKEISLKEGAREFLEELKAAGIPTSICSSNSRNLIEAVIEAHDIGSYFTDIVTCCEVPKGKPAPDVYLTAAKKLGVPPVECLVFEDVPMGILAGKSAGMKVCAVKDAFSEDQMEKKRELADYYISDYYQVLDGSYEVLK